MQEIVINNCHGLFGLTKKAIELIKERKGLDELSATDFMGDTPKFFRHDKDLIEVVKCLGEKASPSFTSLAIISIDEKSYRIKEYDGLETIETPSTIKWIDL